MIRQTVGACSFENVCCTSEGSYIPISDGEMNWHEYVLGEHLERPQVYPSLSL